VSLLVIGHPRQAAAMLGLPAFPWANRLFDGALIAAFVALGCLGLQMLRVLLRRPRPWRETLRSPGSAGSASTGTVMVEFALVLPALLLVTGLIIQLALIANASLMVRYSAFVGARAGIVRLETPPLLTFRPFEEVSDADKAAVERATVLVLATISPQTAVSANENDAFALERMFNPSGSYRYRQRVEYAIENTAVTVTESFSPWKPDDEHLVPPLSGRSPPHIEPPVIWEPPKDFTFSMSLNTVLGALGVGMPLPLTLALDIVGKFSTVPPFDQWLVHEIDLGNYKFKIDIPKLTVSLTIPIPPQIRDPFIVTSDWHPFPKQVKVEVEYKFLLTLPGMNLVPGVTDPTPPGVEGYGVFTITRTVELQSTGVREGSPLAVLYGDPSL
jgi:hypothetical protein